MMHDVPRVLNCVLVTGKGYPDLPTRRVVCLLWRLLRVPILALVDGDPHGFEIMCTYRFGSLKLAYDSLSLACPQMRWLGLRPSDPDLDLIASQPLTKTDHKKLLDLMARPYVRAMPVLQRELLVMQRDGLKRGLEQLSLRRPDFLSRNFLPSCLDQGLFI